MRTVASKAATARKTAIAVAVGLSIVTAPAFSQSNTNGSAFGRIESPTGALVVIESVETGVKRTITPAADGNFSATAMPVGRYKAQLVRNGSVVGGSSEFEVLIGQGSEIVFTALQSVSVVGTSRKLDISTTTSGAMFTARQLDALPIAKNLGAIIQLSPNTTKTDARYNGGASFGGGAATENSYYINGFPVTNPLTQLGSSELPFGAIGQAQVQTGGFGAEFGRSIGGVVNLTSKSGGNTWEGGLALSAAPSVLRNARKSRYWPNTGANPTTDGKLYQAKEFDDISENTVSAYIGGPLIKDKVFLFAAAEKTTRNSGLVVGFGGNPTLAGTSARTGWAEREDANERYLVKGDWNITSDHHVEATYIYDRYLRVEDLSGFDYGSLSRVGAKQSSQRYVNNSDNNLGVGAETTILKYTGYLTDNLTAQVLGGRSISPHPVSLGGYNPEYPQVIVEGNGNYPGFTYNNLQTFSDSIPVQGYRDVTDALRFDLEYKVGKHTLRAGIDKVKLSSLNAGETLAGGRYLTYARTDDPDFQENGMNIALGASSALLSDGFYYYGTERKFSNLSNAYSDQNAQYIEDKYQATKNLLLVFGLRNEQYKNRTTDGQVFLKVKDQLNPRFAFSWDALGNSSTKVFGTVGRYSIQLPTSIALRGANPSLLTDQVFAYTGVAPDGTPTGRVNLGGAFSANNEYGQSKDLNSVSAVGMKPNMQDELTLGIERALVGGINVGARLTYRNLVSTLDDYCDTRALGKWARDRGITDKNGNPFPTYDADGVGNLPFSCATFNPGLANTFLIDYNQDGQYETVNLSAQELGFPKAKRSYMALDFFVERPFRDGWYGRLNYTYSKNRGNAEGQTNSELGQSSIAATVTWDHPELAEYTNGYLPNDRRHQIKAFGFVQLSRELQLGANLLLASGRPRSCLGNYVGGDDEFDNHISYGSLYFYCNGKATQRGSVGNLPWESKLDMNIVYRPEFLGGLTFRADVFNVTNTQTPTAVLERYENNNGTLRNSYERVEQYTSPRSVKLTLSYDKKF